jgi:pimeloyl-ACP methyl ester carboxylesterase
VDELFVGEKKTDAAKIKAYQLKTYYDGQWKPEYDRWVDMLASMYQGEGLDSVAWSQALASDMIFTQPVVHELSRIRVPTILFIGEKDNTAIGKDRAPPEVAKGLGNYPKLAPQVAEMIPGAKLVTFPELGHSPQVQDSMRFNAALMEALGSVP